MEQTASEVPKHHVRQGICATRKIYRDGRRDTAVKVYTISQESRYLMVVGVPAVGASEELVKLCALYGKVDEYRIIDEYPDCEPHTEVYWIKFNKIQAARVAKRKLDDYSFFGGILHVFFSPESETLEDTRQKLAGRRRSVAVQIKRQNAESETKSGETEVTLSIDVVEPTSKRHDNISLSGSTNQHRVNGHVKAGSVTSSTSHVKAGPVTSSTSHVTPSNAEDDVIRNDRPPANQMHFSSHVIHRSTNLLMSYPSNQYMGAPHPTTGDAQGYGRGEHNNSRNTSVSNRPQHVSNRPQHVSSVEKEKRNNSGHSGSLTTEKTPPLAEGEQMIHGVKIKPYISKSTPKFIPRQIRTVRPSTSTGTSTNTGRKSDDLDELIKRNAYVLGPISGPVQRPGVQSQGLSNEEVSLEKTRAAIREKLKTFCPTLLPRQLRKRKRAETEVPFTPEVT